MKDKITMVSFCALLLAMFCIVVFVPTDTRIEETEQRRAAEFPVLSRTTVFNGEFMTGFDAFVADNTGFRSDFIGVSRAFTDFYGIKGEDSAKIVVLNPKTEETPTPTPQKPTETPTQKPTEQPTQTSTAQPSEQPTAKPSEQPTTQPSEPEPTASEAPQIEPIKVGSLLTFPNKLMEIFYYNETTAARYANSINSYREKNGENVRIFSMIIPTQIEFQEEKYREIGDSELLAVAKVNENLIDGIKSVDVYNALLPHKDEYIFFRSDHHWTALGAYYAYLAFAKEAGMTPVTMDYYIENEREGFLGYLYNASPSATLAEDPDTIVYYELDRTKLDIETSNKLIYYKEPPDNVTYSMFIGGDRDIYKINTSFKNGKTCVVIKDSYANCFVPWLVPHYENVIVIDPRTYNSSVTAVMNEYEKVDLIFCNYVFTTTFADLIERVNSIS